MELQMRKNGSRKEPMSVTESTYVDRAAKWGKRLSQTEARGPGDLENAWRRLEARYGIPWRVFWSLRYRRPSSIATGLYQRIWSAYQAECARQMRKLEHELEATRKIVGPDDHSVAAAQALVGKNESVE